jgi:hypothetical protein
MCSPLFRQPAAVRLIPTQTFLGYRRSATTGTLANMSHTNRVPNLRRPFAICFGCDAVAALTAASEDGWALVFRHHRMFGYLCPSCQHPVQQVETETGEATATIVRQQSRSDSPSHAAG